MPPTSRDPAPSSVTAALAGASAGEQRHLHLPAAVDALRQLPDRQVAAQLLHQAVIALQPLAGLGLVRQPAPELLVERGVLGLRPLTRDGDQALVGAEGEFLMAQS